MEEIEHARHFIKICVRKRVALRRVSVHAAEMRVEVNRLSLVNVTCS
jgi:hypothetical protein